MARYNDKVHTDLTFITNEGQTTLLGRFNDLIKNTQRFDVLVGYFFSSGFYQFYLILDRIDKEIQYA